MDLFTIREAIPGDEAAILGFIRELAEYEKLLHEVVATEADLCEALFAENSVAHALITEVDGQPVAFALYFYNFSTFAGRKGIYLEDLYVQPDFRGKGIGRSLLKKLAQIAVNSGCARFEWAALDWNQPAIDVYTGIGAVPMEEWTTFRLDGEALKAFAQDCIPRSLLSVTFRHTFSTLCLLSVFPGLKPLAVEWRTFSSLF